MELFGHLAGNECGELHVVRDVATGLRAFVALHDAKTGRALGGCRLRAYERDEDALVDALRLARGTAYKAALAGVADGGAKAVVIRPLGHFDRAALFRAFGRFVESLGGRYVTGEDSGTTRDDMKVIREETRHVTGLSGDPTLSTALGVRRGIEACARAVLGRRDLEGLRVAVQGVGHVGYALCRELRAQGAHLTVADVDAVKVARAAAEFGAQSVPIGEIFDVECDVLAPCALGSAITAQIIPRLRCRIVAGAANDQLAEPSAGDALFQRDITYAPDYAITAGGFIHLSEEVSGYDPARVRNRVWAIYDTVFHIIERSRRERIPASRVADSTVAERLAARR